jgi:hypothetical protein
VGNGNGYISAGPVRSFCGKVFTNGPVTRFRSPGGLEPTASNSEIGNDHHAAVKALAFKWLRIPFRCWKDRVTYDETKYLAALVKRGSPLSHVVVATVGTRV